LLLLLLLLNGAAPLLLLQLAYVLPTVLYWVRL
jgi:hypothetical protein